MVDMPHSILSLLTTCVPDPPGSELLMCLAMFVFLLLLVLILCSPGSEWLVSVTVF